MKGFGLGLFGTAICAAPLHSQAASVDTLPAAVVQRFVDAANMGDVDAMMRTVAPEAAFATLPGDQRFATGRDSVRKFYERMFARQTGITVTVESRIADGAFAIDHEHFQAPDGKREGHATWIYHVAGGLIRHAWVLRQPEAGGRQ